MKSPAVRILGTATFLVAVDQIIKVWVLARLRGEPPIVLIGPLSDNSQVDTLRFVFVSNSGAAFGLGSNLTFIISLIAIAVVIGLVRWSFKVVDSVWTIAVTLLLAGAAGNLVDRLFQPPGILRGHVVDFISVGTFPVFNFADICITFAALTLLIATITKRNPEGAGNA
ncbi:MAG: signal peptidase II [Candidatus Nanopelagicales bacterium]